MLPRFYGKRHRGTGSRRLGAAAVEMAFVAPILFATVFGAVDFGRAMMVANLLTNTAREAARLGTMPNTTYANVTSLITSQLTAEGITQTGLTTTVQLNTATVTDLSAAKAGDTISVSLSLPYNNVSWLPSSWFMNGKNLNGIAVMVHQ